MTTLAGTLDVLRGVSTSTLTTQMLKRGFRNVFLQGVGPLTDAGGNLVGPAFTLRYIPAREDLDVLEAFKNPEHPQRKAVETVPPGAVLVIDCRRETQSASAGHILVTRLKVRGAAGLVSDGPLRDSESIAAMNFPVYCAGASAPTNLITHHAVDINLPIGCGGVAVYPGDIVVGDGDGVVIIPQHLAAEVAKDAAEQEDLERFVLERIEGGAALPGTYPPDEQTLAAYRRWRADAKT